MEEILSSFRDSGALVRSFPAINGWAIFNKCISLNFECLDGAEERQIPRQTLRA
jgi:hypothetical protein